MRSTYSRSTGISVSIALMLLLGVFACQNDALAPASQKQGKSGARDGVVLNGCTNCTTYTVQDKFHQYQNQAVDAGGNEGLVNTTASASTVFTEMSRAYDKQSVTGSATTSGTITDQAGNTWAKYEPSQSTRDALAAKGFPGVKWSLDWSSGPNQPPAGQKIRFTHD